MLGESKHEYSAGYATSVLFTRTYLTIITLIDLSSNSFFAKVNEY